MMLNIQEYRSLITCRELYFEVVGHVYLIRMGYFPENEIFTAKDHV